MKDQFLYTGEIANLFHVSEHTIRFYEKKGLLVPSLITEKGYKLYGFRAIDRLGQILALRVLDMPIDQIIGSIDQKNPESYEQQLNNMEEIVDGKIRELLSIRSQIRDRKSLVQAYKEEKNSLFIKHFDARYLLPVMPLDSEYAFEIRVPDFYTHLVESEEHPHLHSSRNLIIRKKGDELTLCIQILEPDLSSIDLDRCEILPEGDYLCLFHSTETREAYDVRRSRIVRYLKQNNLYAGDQSIDIYSSDNNIYYEDNESSLFQLLLESE
ncbi:MAG: MerR family transcriptional regulator [Spirochaetales bacterium]|nr:MerR family transcriptional regulator [Spirochaetales bacterium]